MNGTENMFTRIITRVWSDKAEKMPFSGVRKTINYRLAAMTLAKRVFESVSKLLIQVLVQLPNLIYNAQCFYTHK